MSANALSRLANRVGPVWVAVVGLYLLSAVISPAMLQAGQVLNVLQVAAFVGVIAAGQTLVLLAAGIDLSQAGLVTLINVAATSGMAGSNAAILPTVLICIGLALATGLLNALFILRFRVTPLIATLSMNAILFGAALVYTGGAPHGDAAPAFDWIGQGRVAGIPVPTLVWLAVAVLLIGLTRGTVYGRWLYATGANQAAARMMGVPTGLVQAGAYVVSSLAAMIGSLLLTAYVGSPSLGIGDQFLFSSVGAVIVGGTALAGGIGGVAGTVGGAIFITELASFTTIVRVSTGTQMVLQGCIIAASVLLYQTVTRRQS